MLLSFHVSKLVDLSRDLLLRLDGELTNCYDRGDRQDSGGHAGSRFSHIISEALRGLAPDVWSVIAQRGGDIPGWSVLEPKQIYYEMREEKGLSVGFYVNPAYRRLGIGKQILQEDLRLARRLGVRCLFGSPWNNGSEAFFTSLGFRNVITYRESEWTGVAELDVFPASNEVHV